MSNNDKSEFYQGADKLLEQWIERHGLDVTPEQRDQIARGLEGYISLTVLYAQGMRDDVWKASIDQMIEAAGQGDLSTMAPASNATN